MTRAYRTGNTLVVASLAYVTVVLASLFGVFWWSEHLSLDAWFAIALIILSGVISVRTTQAPQQAALNQAEKTAQETIKTVS